MRVLGVIIMLLAFSIIPDQYPWYYSVLLFDVGLLLVVITKWNKLKKELGLSTQSLNI